MKKFFVLVLITNLLLYGCGSEKNQIDIQEPVIMGIASFDNYALVLELYDGVYESVFSVGPDFGANWTGEYQLAIVNCQDNFIVDTYQLQEWEEPLCFHENVSLTLTDYNQDGMREVLIGQYTTNNFNTYRMYYITEDLEIGYYSEIGAMEISSKELSPMLEMDGDVVKYNIYDNSIGNMTTKELAIEFLKCWE